MHCPDSVAYWNPNFGGLLTKMPHPKLKGVALLLLSLPLAATKAKEADDTLLCSEHASRTLQRNVRYICNIVARRCAFAISEHVGPDCQG